MNLLPESVNVYRYLTNSYWKRYFVIEQFPLNKIVQTSSAFFRAVRYLINTHFFILLYF
jgi:hypothetical protein